VPKNTESACCSAVGNIDVRPACDNITAARRLPVPTHAESVKSKTVSDGLSGVEEAGGEVEVSSAAVARAGVRRTLARATACGLGAAQVQAEAEETKALKPAWLVTPFRGKGIYLAIANDFPFFKVGSSRDVKTRAASLRWVMPGGMRMRNFWPVETWSSSLLRLIEVHIQARLGRWSCDGEWFHTDPKALAIVDTWTELPELAKSPDELRYSWKRLRVWLEHHYALGGV